MSVHWPVIRNCLANPFATAVVDDRATYTRGKVLLGALVLADRLRACSSSRTLGIMLPTGGLFPMTALAAWMADRVVVPLNYLLAKDELQFVIDDCGCDTIVTVGPMLEHLGYRPRVGTLLELDKVDFKAMPEPRWPAMAGAGELAVLLYTSGTSGRPKGVMLTHGNIAANVRQCRDWIDFTSRDVVLGVLPQFHSFGLTVLTMLPLTAGARAVYTARFMPGKIVRLFREHRPTYFVAIPSMYNALLHAKDATPADFASLKCAVSGGEPLPRAVADAFRERFNVTIAEGYGLTETSPVTNWCRPQDYKPGSVGMPLEGVRERIVCIEDGRDLGPDADGEVRIKGPNVMRGYYNRPAETAAAFDELGWFRTGDIGRIDRDGHLFITGRLKEMLIIGGENVFPREIEEVLNAHPAVKDSGVVGMADPMRGEQPIGFVELKEGQAVDAAALVTWCRGKLAGYKVPAEVRVVEALPRNATGKVMRRQLKGMVAAG